MSGRRSLKSRRAARTASGESGVSTTVSALGTWAIFTVAGGLVNP
jgi:hypothetical protein